jgi:hypothetical protein
MAASAWSGSTSARRPPSAEGGEGAGGVAFNGDRFGASVGFRHPRGGELDECSAGFGVVDNGRRIRLVRPPPVDVGRMVEVGL